jgi:heme ABC exporter ATP-binding subunit CcmA
VGLVPLRLASASKRFGRLAVLRSIDLEVTAGQTVALLGANGCGKTTLLSIAAGLQSVTTGACTWGAPPVVELDRQARRSLAYVAHATQVYARLTARENLELVDDLRGDAGGRARIDALLERVGLAHATDRSVGQFSRGMQQRLAIARALVGRPELMLLDEPFTALDVAGREMLAQILAEERARGAAILLTSHDLETVAEVSDAAVLLVDGRIVERVTRATDHSTAAFATAVRGLGATGRPRGAEQAS